jgi:hypothetical protein
MRLLNRLRAAADAHVAAWIVDGVRDFHSVACVLPAVFEDYARVFHPAMRDGVEVRWTDVASANGHVMHPAAEWGSLTGSWQLQGQPDLWDEKPSTGELPLTLATRLAESLAEFTRDAEHCLFGVWEGWGVPDVIVAWREGTSEEDARRAQQAVEAEITAWHDLLDSAPAFDLPAQRTMHVLEGPLDAVSEFYEGDRDPPSLWWPENRAWCVGTDIDLMTTYVGGSGDAISALLADEQVEVLRVPVDQSVTWQADTVNPLPGPPW